MSRRPRLLIIDDDAELRQIMQDALEDEGYESVTAGNGQQALEILYGSDRPDAILLDLMMPVMNGWQFREIQRNHPRLRDIPVLIITASRNPSRDLSLDPAGEKILFKPFGLETLLDAVHSLLAR